MSIYEPRDEVAIIGIACKFPGANNYNQFWDNLEQGMSSINEIPIKRWQLSTFYSPEPQEPNKSISKWGGFIEGIDQFDAQFFGISAREAIRMDPQQRLMLELSWSCLEDAGYTPSELSGSPVGVFIGACNYDYDQLQRRYEDKIEGHTVTGTHACMIPNRISYLFNFSGPSVPVDTACSSSLVAIHQAVHAIKERECELALVGGVNVICTPESYISLSQMGMLSPSGQCKSFDSEADGYVRGEGAGVVLLKPLRKAIKDKDNIYGVIKGSAINHGGKAQTLTSPNVYAQAKVIYAAFRKASIAPHTVSYIETHGTGTPKGDPIETNGLKRAFRQLYIDHSIAGCKQPYCGLGSVKTNIGHLEAAAGIAGLIKVVLAMKHRRLPKTNNIKQLNPRVKLDDSPFYIIRETQEWNHLITEGKKIIPRRAGVSSFGLGGVNAHVVLEEAPSQFQAQNSFVKNKGVLKRPLHLFTLSAKTEKALDELVDQYHLLLEADSKSELTDICYTANTGRVHFNHRLVILASNQQELKEKLLQKQVGREVAGLFSGQLFNGSNSPKTVFLFTGQGSQYINMGWRLYQTQPSFRQAIDRCNEILHEQLEHPLGEVLYPQTKDGLSLPLLDQTAYTQPALFAIEYALFELWKSWGIQPDIVMGHSVGEYVAATVAGVFSLEDGLKLIANRGRLMQQLPSGGEMVAVTASEEKMRSLITPYKNQVALAAINGPNNVVISGGSEAIEAICDQLQFEGINIEKLQVSHAFHSPLMEPILAEFEAVANQITYNQPQIPLISNLTGYQADENIAAPQYWVNHIRQPVRFAQGMETLHKQGYKIFLEIGPKPTLLSMGRQCLPVRAGVWLPSMHPKVDEWQQLLSSLGQLYVQGFKIDWSGFDRDYARQKVVLPTYPFQRQRYWIDTSQYSDYEKSHSSRKKNLHPLLGQQLSLAGLEKEYYFESYITEDQPSYLTHHRVFDQALFPTTAYLEMALAAGSSLFSTDLLTVENLIIRRGLILSSEETKTVQTKLIPSEDGKSQFQIFTKQQQNKEHEPLWELHAQGEIRASKTDTTVGTFNVEKCKAECTQHIDVKQHYQQYHNQGIEYGANFQGILDLWKGSNQAFAKIHLSSELVEQGTDYQFHPALLDAAFQVIAHILPEISSNQTYLPIGIDRFRIYGRPNLTLWVSASIAEFAELKVEGKESFVTQLTIVSDEGKIVAVVEGLRVKRATPQALLGNEQSSITNWLYEVEWRAKARFGRLLPPEYLLTPSEIKQELNLVIPELITQIDLDNSKKVLTQLEELSVDYVMQAFLEMGWTYKLGEVFSKDSAAQYLDVVPSQRSLFNRMLHILAEVSTIQENQQQWQVLRTLEEVDLESKSQALLGKYPDARAELNLLHHCGSQLCEVLQGRTDPVQLMFPGGDLTITTQFYQESPTAKVMNTLVQQAITKAIERFPKQRGIRLLEIGSGTGSTTSYILPHLSPSQTEYMFTDIGALFTTKAKEKFQDYPFVRYQTLDIEVDPALQGFEPYQYDVIIAANVLHATISMSQTMTHVRKLLAPEGILVISEATTRQRWLDLVFGQLEGWWKFNDLELRPDYPLLSTEKWKQLLSQVGFAQADVLSETDGESTLFSQQAVIVAKADKSKVDQISSESKGWLILADQEGIAQTLSEQLRSTGEVCTLVVAGEKYQQVAPEKFTINPHDPEEFQRVIDQVATTLPNLYGVVQCWTVEAGISHNLDSEELESLSKLGCGSTLFLVQALVKGRLSQTPRLWLVTQGAQSVPESHSVVPGVAQSSVWGMGKVIALEHPELNCVRIDLDPNLNVEQKGLALWSEVRSEDIEDQVALREDSRYVARLVSSRYRQKVVNQQQKVLSTPFRLTMLEKGILENLILEPTTRRVPNQTEVEIQVNATGLNFYDVVGALGLIPQEVDGVSQENLQETDSFGGECVGEIVAVGEEVKGFEIGDSVIALASGSFSQYVIVDASYVVLKPENLSFEEAATIPVNFLTAYYALHHVAKISAGDQVLIHAAAGGTGMAAVQIAHQAGAEVLATASPQKWETLRRMGVQHIMNSRTTEFADQVMEITQGRGVNVVLNSLTSGEFITKSLSVVSPQGSFVEIGKRGVWDSAKIAKVRPNISYFVVDLIRESKRQPNFIKSILQKLRNQFAEGLLQPPPLKLFSMDEVISAFRYMQQAKHVGKIVVTQTAQQTDAATQVPLSFREDRTYLITGGMGGLGLIVAHWMIKKGAKHLILVGRRPPDAIALSKLAEFKQEGAQVIVEEADVSQFESMKGVLSKVNQLIPPLAGVFHLAGMLSDSVLQNQSWSSFEKVMSPKIQGAWHLHQLTQNQPLEFFVLFSSTASLLGVSGQGNHCAANAFLDGLAHYRRAIGLPGLSIQWGAVSQVGEAAERGADIRVQQKGMDAISPTQVIEVLELLMSGSGVEVGVVPIVWQAWQERAARWPFLADWEKASAFTKLSTMANSDRLLEQLKVTPDGEKESILSTHLQGEVARVLGMADSRIDMHQPLTILGLDSLMAVELANRFKTELQVNIPMSKLVEGITIAALSTEICQQLLLRHSLTKQYSVTIPVVSERSQFPLSFAQQRLWFIDQLEGASATYNIPATLRLTGCLDVQALQQSFETIVQRHEVLRTSFQTLEGVAIQIIGAPFPMPLEILDLQPLDEAAQPIEVQRLTQEEAQQPFDLATGPLLRVKLLQLAPQEHVLLLTMHHIISDGWSIGVLVQELSSLYQAFTTDTEANLPALPIQYADFAHWQRQHLQGEVLDAHLSYWKEQLADAPPLLELPTDRPRPSVQSFKGASLPFSLTPELTERLQQLSQQTGATLFMTLLSAFQVLLYRYSGQEDIVVGSPIANRNRSETEGLIGFFANTLALRSRLDSEMSFEELLTQVRQVTLEAYTYQDVPFEKLVEELQPERSLSYTPLIQVIFALQNAPITSLKLSDLSLSPLNFNIGLVSVRFDLEMHLWEGPKGLNGFFIYNTDLFDLCTIQHISKRFQTLLESIVINPKNKLSDLLLLTPLEQQQLLSSCDVQANADYAEKEKLLEGINDLSDEEVDALLKELIDKDSG
jgi:acyl transferase domain-containing protein/acyl carrier protein